MTNILQSELLVNFLYPLLLMFFITYGVLQKTKVLGENKQQLDAGVALIVGLIFVGAIFPKIMVANLIQFLTVGLVVIFVGLMLWGFISGSELKTGAEIVPKWAAWILVIIVGLGVIWATGAGAIFTRIFEVLFDSDWSSSFWSNVIFILALAVGVAVVLGKPKK